MLFGRLAVGQALAQVVGYRLPIDQLSQRLFELGGGPVEVGSQALRRHHLLSAPAACARAHLLLYR